MHDEIIAKLNEAGHDAFLVGGCVRDELLGLVPKDFDVVTSAVPDQIEEVFSDQHIVGVGRQFGILVINGVEVATFRSESGGDGRRPGKVNLGVGLKQDIVRRDFTMNGLLKSGNVVLDLVGGQRDIRNKVVRFIGNPNLRIEEDKLRMLRAVRFAHCLGFTIEPTSLTAIRANASGISNISNERIKAELDKMLESNNKGFINALDHSGLLPFILPSIEATKGIEQHPTHHPEGDVFTHISMVVDNTTGEDLVTRWAAVFHDIGKPATYDFNGGKHSFHGHDAVGAKMAGKIMRELRFPANIIDEVCWLVRHHMIHNFMERRRTKQIALMEHPLFPKLVRLHEADCMGRKTPVRDFFEQESSHIDSCRRNLVTGNDLVNLGLVPGPDFKFILNEVKEAQRAGLVKTREEAIEFIKAQNNG